MKRFFGVIFLAFILLVLGVSLAEGVLAQEEVTCVVYFTGVGCPHCAKTDPILLTQLPKEHSGLVIIEYEIYQQRENAPLLYEYNDLYGSGLGIPLVIFSKEEHLVGDTPILQGVEKILEERKSNRCPLMDGSSVAFDELDLSSLPGKPKIWTKERVLISSEEETDNTLLKELLSAEDVSRVLEGREFETVDPQPVPLSGKNVEFKNAVKTNGWVFEWGFPVQEEDRGIPWNIVAVVTFITGVGVSILWLVLRRTGGRA